ncbi:hypothetical protein CALVIDRAFT_104383 [Calocera viscosa TUFC12733]|uniref:RING-type E3 ubiquitin transferase n=1 Tax=Calocera viscosa (strain TUFC12733) TaxID=1330018 RepID=A0A167MNZ4_CALVF|nr:hypothetical protein CALVIDRAFT_104383 [Calocera viscosa TUFC12733]
MGQHHSTLPPPPPPAPAAPSTRRTPSLPSLALPPAHRPRPRSTLFQSLRRATSPYPSTSPRSLSPSSPSPSSQAQEPDTRRSAKRKLGDVFRSRRKRARTRSVLGLMGTGVATPASTSADSAERIDVEEEEEEGAGGSGQQQAYDDFGPQEEMPLHPPDLEREDALARRDPDTHEQEEQEQGAEPLLTTLLSQTLSSLSQLPTPAPSELHAPSSSTTSDPLPLPQSDPLAAERARARELLQSALGLIHPPVLPLGTEVGLLPPAPAPPPLPLPAETPTTPTPSASPAAQLPLPLLPPIPTGTTMIVQGLVQTSAHHAYVPRDRERERDRERDRDRERERERDTDRERDMDRGAERGLIPLPMPVGSVEELGDREQRQEEDRDRGRDSRREARGRRSPSPSPSLEEQANMLSTLLSVATAATAASLVSGTTASSASSTNAVPTAPAGTPTGPTGPSASAAPAPAPSSTLFSPPPPSSLANGGANANSAQTLRSMLDTLRERLQRSAAAPGPPRQQPQAFTTTTTTTPGTLAQQASLLSSQHASLASELAALNTQMQQITEQMSAAAGRMPLSPHPRGTGADALREDLAGELTRRLLAAAGAGEAARRGLEEAERRIAELERSLLSRLSGGAPVPASEPEPARPTASPPGQRAREILMDALAAAASHRPTPLSGARRQQEQEFPSALAALPAWTASRQADPPGEGTFERFLWELQVDLRALLVGRGEGRRERRPEGPSEEQQEGAEGAGALAAEEADVPPPSASSSALPQAQVPSLQQNAPAPAPGRTGTFITTSNGGTTQGGTENDGERLNWWRMYRFPARNVPGENTEPSTEAGATGPNITEEPRTPPRRLRPQAEDETVIPVILVGLRSVTPGNPAPALFDFADPPSAPASPVEDRQPALISPATQGNGLEPWTSRDRDDGASIGSGSSAAGGSTGSGNNNGVWQRAARLWNRGPRTERGRSQPAQQPAERDPLPSGVGLGGMDETQGTRSYIIWVVGGHYPPNHPIITAPHLLTGQLDHDDLWALGELLGQVKPPTATREEIEKSGLEVIRVTRLKEWEESGRVASNCTERCLICLGDYEDEEGEDGDVRVLGCRHCFHKLCVDRWLEQGKNNCPACRSKGVPTSSSPSSPTTETREVQTLGAAAATVATDDTPAPTAIADA